MDLELCTIPRWPHAIYSAEPSVNSLNVESADHARLTVWEVPTGTDVETLDIHGAYGFPVNGNDPFPAATGPAASCPFCPTSGGVSGQPTVESLLKPVRAHWPPTVARPDRRGGT